MITAGAIEKLIENIDRVNIVDGFITNENGALLGRIKVKTYENGGDLEWNVVIAPSYPFKIMGSESIRFFNEALIDYPHIMEGGFLCMHPAEYNNTEDQFVHDLEQLKEWIDDYYIGGKKDEHYEHLVVNHNLVRNHYFTYCFAETQEEFEDEDYGLVSYAMLAKGLKNKTEVINNIVQRFISLKNVRKRENPCRISRAYLNLESHSGVYCLLKEIPSIHNKFIIKDFDSLKYLFTQNQKNFIHTFEKQYLNKVKYFPLFCGYKLPDGSIHWQAMVLYMDDLPIEPFCIGTGRNRVWYTDFISGVIPWVQTEDISYKYFFGRGAIPQELADKKILIIGVGAIGSTVAETLTRCGAKRITIYDIDNKEPGNVCRSAYPFYSGITEKTQDIIDVLQRISPHVECDSLKPLLDVFLKEIAAEEKDIQPIAKLFNVYDVIFDCTTDNQLMRVIDNSGITAQVINLSITNYAQDLVCAFSPNITETVRLIYKVLNRDTESDLYNPTGCWTPTFKASFNDIACKVQFALKHIIRMLNEQEPRENFYVTEDETNLIINRL